MHNALYDLVHNARYFVTRGDGCEMPSIILNIVVMIISHTTFLDSLNYLRMPLSTLPSFCTYIHV